MKNWGKSVDAETQIPRSTDKTTETVTHRSQDQDAPMSPRQREPLKIYAELRRKCCGCKIEKLLEEFPNRKQEKHGKHYRCYPCLSIYRKQQRRANAVREKHTNFKGKLKKNFGLTVEEYQEMLSEQKDRCAICRKHWTEQSKKLAVDHCHGTGRIRGLLCSGCNFGLGLFADSKKRLLIAIAYLEKSKKRRIKSPRGNKRSAK